ncbi:flavin reductase family protein [Pseudonocardia sp. C8]|uniref:flavin reductase family protein n=1 Tax=Pseudonocardia sp. C8 TaxID=2762759 RepID=UPI00351C9169
MPFTPPDASAMRRCMGRFTTGVAVVTALDAAGEPQGMTINSLTSVSVDPCVLLVSLTVGTRTADAVDASGAFAISILGVRQEATARRFATRGGARFEGVEAEVTDSGIPIVGGALVHADCRVHTTTDVGDHRVYFGEVGSLRDRAGTGLTFHSGRFGEFHDLGHAEMPWLF